jgi:hypothetical protein
VSLLDDLNGITLNRPQGGGVRCSVARLLASLPEEDAAALEELIDGTDVFATQIAEILHSHGHDISSGKIQHHRRRARGAGCHCPPPKASE